MSSSSQKGGVSKLLSLRPFSKSKKAPITVVQHHTNPLHSQASSAASSSSSTGHYSSLGVDAPRSLSPVLPSGLHVRRRSTDAGNRRGTVSSLSLLSTKRAGPVSSTSSSSLLSYLVTPTSSVSHSPSPPPYYHHHHSATSPSPPPPPPPPRSPPHPYLPRLPPLPPLPPPSSLPTARCPPPTSPRPSPPCTSLPSPPARQEAPQQQQAAAMRPTSPCSSATATCQRAPVAASCPRSTRSRQTRRSKRRCGAMRRSNSLIVSPRVVSPSPEGFSPASGLWSSSPSLLYDVREFELLIDRGDSVLSQLRLSGRHVGSRYTYAQIKAGTATALVACLVEMYIRDEEYIDLFLIAYRAFLPAEALARALLTRFDFSLPALANTRQLRLHDKWDLQIKSRVIAVFEKWLALFGSEDFEASPSLLAHLRTAFQSIEGRQLSKFQISGRARDLAARCAHLISESRSLSRADTTITPSHAALAAAFDALNEKFGTTMTTTTTTTTTTAETTTNSSTANATVSGEQVVKAISELKSCGIWEATEWVSELQRSGYLASEGRLQYRFERPRFDMPRADMLAPFRALLDLPPDELARRLNDFDRLLISKVSIVEFTGQRWTGTDGAFVAPNICLIVEASNILTYCLGEALLRSDDVDQMKAHVNTLLRTCRHLLGLRNFNSLTTLSNVLQLSPVSRLKTLWGAVSPKSRALRDKVHDIVSPVHNYRNLRKTLDGASDGTTVIPYFGLILRDLVGAELGNPTFFEHLSGFINFEKFLIFGRILANFVSIQIACKQSAGVKSAAAKQAHRLMSAVLAVPTTSRPSDDDLYALSGEIEPMLTGEDRSQNRSPRSPKKSHSRTTLSSDIRLN